MNNDKQGQSKILTCFEEDYGTKDDDCEEIETWNRWSCREWKFKSWEEFDK
jgi:hypothetical protein